MEVLYFIMYIIAGGLMGIGLTAIIFHIFYVKNKKFRKEVDDTDEYVRNMKKEKEAKNKKEKG